MTRHETILREALLAELGTTIPSEGLTHLFELGIVDIRACERLAIRAEIEQLCRNGTPRCEAMHTTASKFCCSYEKVRSAFYNTQKQ